MSASNAAKIAKNENEAARLEELYSLGLLDSLSDMRFDQFTKLAAEIFSVPIALVSLVDAGRQWFKSAHGLEVRETPRDISFCTHAIEQNDNFVVPDALKDERFKNTPLVVGNPNIRFYAGSVLRGPKGYSIGTCCIIDRQPREFSEQDSRVLTHIAHMIEYEIEARQILKSVRGSIGEIHGKDFTKKLDHVIAGTLQNDKS